MARANVSVSDDQNFRSRCEQEQKAFDDWPNKWEWILDEYKYCCNKSYLIYLLTYFQTK